MQRIERCVAFVSGAASGIGYAIAAALIGAGARAVLTDIDAAELERAVVRLGENAAGCVLDVTDRHQWSEAKAFVERRFGPVEILVCNAGVRPNGQDLADMDPADFERVLGINLTGVFNGIATFAAGLRARGDGHIVLTASNAGLTPIARCADYVASKFGVLGLGESLRMEMAPRNVGVSVLCPGGVWSRLTQPEGMTREKLIAMRGNEHKMIEASEVGRLVLAGIRQNRSHIHTHGELRKSMARRAAELLQDFEGVPRRDRACPS